MLGLASFLPLAWLQARPHDAHEVAAIFAPWSRSESLLLRIREADVAIVRQGYFSNIVVVRSENPEFVHRLYRAGAWAVLDPAAFGGCLAGTGNRPDASS